MVQESKCTAIHLLSTDLRLLAMRTRMPFRYGIATMTALPHARLFVRVAIDGREVQGVAADHLPPKWFTKDPRADFVDEINTASSSRWPSSGGRFTPTRRWPVFSSGPSASSSRFTGAWR